jgi:hypothetical protein
MLWKVAQARREVGIILEDNTVVPSKTVVTKEWVVFDDDDSSVREGHCGNYGNQFMGNRDLLLL